jgi:RecA-family ATPase
LQKSSCIIEEEKIRFSFFDGEQLLDADFKSIYLCNGVLAKDQPTIIGGPTKSFKTSVGMELAVCLATGEKFLDQFKVPKPVPILFFAGEGGKSNIQSIYKRIIKAKGADRSRLKKIYM